MTTDLLDWHEEDEEAVNFEAEYRILLNGLRRTHGFGLFFVQCSPFGGEQIIQRVREDLPDQNVKVLKLDAPLTDGNVYKRVQLSLKTHPATQILFIQGLELSLLDYEESKKRLGWSSEKIFSYSWHGVPPVLINLNQQRERFRDSFDIRFVFLLPAFTVKYLVHRAPDFFDWRSGIARLQDNADTLTRESHRIHLESSYTYYRDWSQKQRNHRILEIQSLIESKRINKSVKASLCFEQGNIFFISKDYEASVAAYNAALAVKPDFYAALYNKGVALDNAGFYEASIATYNAVLLIKRDDFATLLNKGRILEKLGRYAEANIMYDAALVIDSNNYEALLKKAYVLGQLGRSAESAIAHNTALAVKSKRREQLNTKKLLW